MHESEATRSAHKAGRSVQQRAAKTVEQSIGSQELHQHLKTHGRAEIDGWAINVDGVETWLTNSYGIDVGLCANNAEGCVGILERISTDGHERE